MSNGKPRPGRTDYERALKSINTYMDIAVDDLMDLAERAQHFAELRETESLTVAGIMTHPVQCVHPQTTMSEAAHLMTTARVSGLPVVDDDERLAGIITEADFLRALGVPAQKPTQNLWETLEALFDHLAHVSEVEGPDDPVRDHMVTDVVCAEPDQRVDDVLAQMKAHRVKRVVICDPERRVTGIVTRSDLVRIFFDRYKCADADS